MVRWPDFIITGADAAAAPAGFYERLDTVPEPLTVALLALGMFSLALSRR